MRDGAPSAATSNFNAVRFSLLHQTCSQGADDEAEHGAKYHQPDRCICDSRRVRFESYLCLHILCSTEPQLIKNAEDRESESAQHKDNSFGAVVPDYRRVVEDFGVTTKQLIAPLVDEHAGAEGKKQRNRESNAQRGYTGGVDGEEKSERIHIDLTRWRKTLLPTGRSVSG
jgi:hypothetical protein